MDVESAEEALAKVGQYQPNIIVLDVVYGRQERF